MESQIFPSDDAWTFGKWDARRAKKEWVAEGKNAHMAGHYAAAAANAGDKKSTQYFLARSDDPSWWKDTCKMFEKIRTRDKRGKCPKA